jgi:hypothetical protein
MATIHFIWNGADVPPYQSSTSYHLGSTSGYFDAANFREWWTGVNLTYSPSLSFPTGGTLHSWSFQQKGSTHFYSFSGLSYQIPPGTSYDSLMTGLMSGRDMWHGNGADNFFFWSVGGDTYYGGAGIDTLDAVGFRKALLIGSKPTFTRSGETIGVTAVGDLDVTLNSVERLRFWDVSVALDLDGNAGAVARIVGAVFGRDQVKSKDLVGIGIGLLDSGMAPLELTHLALKLRLGDNYSSSALVKVVYKNVTNTAPTALDMQLYGSMLADGLFTGAELAWAAAESALNATSIDLTGLAATGLDYLPWQD